MSLSLVPSYFYLPLHLHSLFTHLLIALARYHGFLFRHICVFASDKYRLCRKSRNSRIIQLEVCIISYSTLNNDSWWQKLFCAHHSTAFHFSCRASKSVTLVSYTACSNIRVQLETFLFLLSATECRASANILTVLLFFLFTRKCIKKDHEEYFSQVPVYSLLQYVFALFLKQKNIKKNCQMFSMNSENIFYITIYRQ